jgi:hypothetical protein
MLEAKKKKKNRQVTGCTCTTSLAQAKNENVFRVCSSSYFPVEHGVHGVNVNSSSQHILLVPDGFLRASDPCKHPKLTNNTRLKQSDTRMQSFFFVCVCV